MKLAIFLFGIVVITSCEQSVIRNEFKIVSIESNTTAFKTSRLDSVIFDQSPSKSITGVEITFLEHDKNSFIQAMAAVAGEEVSLVVNGNEVDRYYVTNKSMPKNFLKFKINNLDEEVFETIRIMSKNHKTISSPESEAIRQYDSFEDFENSFKQDFSRYR